MEKDVINVHGTHVKHQPKVLWKVGVSEIVSEVYEWSMLSKGFPKTFGNAIFCCKSWLLLLRLNFLIGWTNFQTDILMWYKLVYRRHLASFNLWTCFLKPWVFFSDFSKGYQTGSKKNSFLWHNFQIKTTIYYFPLSIILLYNFSDELYLLNAWGELNFSISFKLLTFNLRKLSFWLIWLTSSVFVWQNINLVVHSRTLTLFRMGLFGVADGWAVGGGGGRAGGKKNPCLKSDTNILQW